MRTPKVATTAEERQQVLKALQDWIDPRYPDCPSCGSRVLGRSLEDHAAECRYLQDDVLSTATA